MSSPDVSPMRTVLTVDSLSVAIRRAGAELPVVRDVSFALEEAECLALVGESGCGKSMTALSLMRLLPVAAHITHGTISLQGTNLVALADPEMRQVRGNRIAMIYQDPMSSLNPVLTIGRQIAEAIEAHTRLGRRAAWSRAVELLDSVGVPAARHRAHDFPHQFSGGMRQRVMIAAAIACGPAVLVADEPTTALDVTVRAQILELIQDLRVRLKMAVILISHDLGVVAGVADRVAVMYAGRIVEAGAVHEMYARPAHPYTQGLLASIPRLDRPVADRHLGVIPGRPPALIDQAVGCPFRPRCAHAFGKCAEVDPDLTGIERGHDVACWWATDSVGAVR
jgi:oligopeptide/dipeptide ABC transporter ATP-binding protein